MKRLTKETFIERAKLIHGDVYDYSKVVYVNIQTKVCIICPKHGEFFITPSNHIYGHGCPKCKAEKTGNLKRFTTEEFIGKAVKVHGNKYDYSKTKYVSTETKVCIICPKHGDFWQTPHSHLSGRGCDKCGGTHLLTTEEFINRAREIHGSKYDYSKVKYMGNKIPVCIVCHEHGEFYQRPSDHLNGHGCPVCSESHLERDMAVFLKKNDISFEREKSFHWLRNKLPLHLDFYLPDFNVIIECQGIQHFEPVSFGSKNTNVVENYEYVKTIDKLKKDLCIKHGLKVLYYSDLNICFPYEVFVSKNKLLEMFT